MFNVVDTETQQVRFRPGRGRLAGRWLTAALMVALSACGAPTPGGPSPAQPAPVGSLPVQFTAPDGTTPIALDGGDLVLAPGDAALGTWISGGEWTSDDASVLRVTPGGAGRFRLDALEAGETSLHGQLLGSAQAGQVSARTDLRVRVRPRPGAVSVALSAAELTLVPGQRFTLTASVRGSANPAVGWRSSDPKVASVSASGQVTALTSGRAIITASSAADPNKTASAAVTVAPPTPGPAPSVTGVALDSGDFALAAGQSRALRATVSGTGGFATGVAWTSSDPAVASVDAQGQVSALAAGRATITATSTADASKSARLTLTVTAPAPGATVTGVAVTPATLSLSAGQGASLNAVVSGSGAFNPAVTWSSNNPAAVSVDAQGHVQAVAVGSATVTATSLGDPSKRASASVSVGAAPSISGVALDTSSFVLIAGQTRTLRATVSGSGTFDSGVLWSSNNPSVASVDSAGVVTARAAGSATITATSRADAGQSAGAALSVTAPAPTPTPTPSGDPFNITLVFPANDGLTESQRQIFRDAAARWERVITAGLPDVMARLPDGTTRLVDDVAIEASGVSIDGVGNVLGQAGPYMLRDNGLPATGVMEFDSADLAAMEKSGTLRGVILHEMGHVLGIGTLWDADLSYDASTCDASSQIQFNGVNALREYRALGGQAAGVPVENTGGSGTKCGHWSEAVFKTELMTGWASGSMPLSKITVGALADLGYSVNYAAADAYSLPTAFTAQSEPGFQINTRLLFPKLRTGQ